MKNLGKKKYFIIEMVGEWAKERGKDVTTTKTTKNMKFEILYSD